ncbi:type II secretion system protein [Fictibacillus aquaticus]|uniref:type II secretion system protein n=1 Tax=Fictibacillus aquaticus TaxID=2021314 RepID=UPI0026A65048
MNLLKKQLKNEKGLTLIELLVVVVILGIIAAIAVVSVGGILDNSKKDAHVANAQQMVNVAKMYASSTALKDGDTDLKLTEMYSKDLLDTMIDPDTKAKYTAEDTSLVKITKAGSKYTYTVTLIGRDKKITAIAPEELDRDDVSEVE